jgi:tetratricopeptide (TPR) repeat protein
VIASLLIALAMLASPEVQPRSEVRPQLASSGVEELFSEANAAFLSGDPAKAIALYEALLAEGVASPELETNLGAALQRQGKHGPAALHFERALFLMPGDDDARADLLEVRKGNVDRLEGEAEDGGVETLIRALSPVPGPWASLALLIFWSLAWAALAVKLLLPSLARRAPFGAIAAALFGGSCLAAFLCAGAAAASRLALSRAVVVSLSAPVREGPDAKSASPFEVHEGTPVRLEDLENGFARIKLANGLTGWVPQAAVELVVPRQWRGGAQPG